MAAAAKENAPSAVIQPPRFVIKEKHKEVRLTNPMHRKIWEKSNEGKLGFSLVEHVKDGGGNHKRLKDHDPAYQTR